MGNQQHGHALARHLFQDAQNFSYQLGVERGGNFVEQHDVGRHGQRPRDCHPLLLPARQLVGIGVYLFFQPHLAQGRQSQCRGLGGGHAFHNGRPERDVAFHREVREQVVALKNDADMGSQSTQIGGPVVYRHAIDPDLAALDRFQPVDAAQQRAFAGARAPDDGNDFAFVDAQVDVLQNGVLPKALDHGFQFNEWHAASLQVFCCSA